MDRRNWIRFLPWRQKNNAESKSAQIKFAPNLTITRQDGWKYLELQLVNRSSQMVWVEEASIVLADLEAILQAEVPTGHARHQILQNVRANETLRVSLASAVYDAAGRPQARYSCLVRTNVRYRVLNEWCNAKLGTFHVEMAALSVCGLHSARWYDEKIKQTSGSIALTPKEHKG